jgi:hypothetical protein
VVARRGYGIEDAVQLMRTLPLNQNQDLVLLVVRNTLSSMNVNLKSVIDDGAAKQERLSKTIADIKGGIAELEREMSSRKQELAAVEADLAETTAVRERLEAAAQRELPIVPPIGSAAPKPPVPSGRSGHGKSHGAPPAPPPSNDRETMEIDPLPESESSPGT